MFIVIFEVDIFEMYSLVIPLREFKKLVLANFLLQVYSNFLENLDHAFWKILYSLRVVCHSLTYYGKVFGICIFKVFIIINEKLFLSEKILTTVRLVECSRDYSIAALPTLRFHHGRYG